MTRGGRKTKGANKLRSWLVLAAALLLSGLLLTYLPAFRLQAVLVDEPLRSVDPAAFDRVCQLQAGRHLFQELGGSLKQLVSLRYGPVEARLEAAFPTIKEARVRMQWPGQIHCQVIERIEVAWLALPDGCVVIDKEGVALSSWAEQPDMPVIEGLQVHAMVLGQVLTVDVPEALSRAITLLGAIIEADLDRRTDVALFKQVKAIRPASGRQLYMTLTVPDTGERLEVLTETGPDLVETMLWLRFALDQGALNKLDKGLLDLTGGRKTFMPDG